MLAKGVSKYHQVSLLQQFNSLRYCPLTKNGFGKFNKNCFYWEFEASPSEFSKKYRVLIIYHSDNYSPSVYVLDKDIWQISKSKQIPHLYDFKKIKLCLYYPDYNEWSSKMLLCNTIVAWSYLWLYFYEEWLYTNDWKGGGIHPESKNDDTDDEPNTLKKTIIKDRKKKKKDTVSKVINNIYQSRKKAYLDELEK